jgi:hypothetical protein
MDASAWMSRMYAVSIRVRGAGMGDASFDLLRRVADQDADFNWKPYL